MLSIETPKLGLNFLVTTLNSPHFRKVLDRGALCPPPHFALVIEPLFRAISANINIKGYQKGPKEYKLSLYADDVLLFLTNPLIALPNPY